MKRIGILATLNTKGDEARFLAECIGSRGHTPVLFDLSLIRDSQSDAGDVSREAVARAAGRTGVQVERLQRAEAMEVMAAGARVLIGEMLQRGELHAVVGIGGGTGTWMSAAVMDSLPIGFPKLVVSTLGSRTSHTDTTVMPSVADIAGLNSVLTPILANAAAAVSGMAEGVAAVRPKVDRPSIAMTMFGVTTRGGTYAREFLEAAGCEVVVFHANGSGGATMEDLIRRGTFVGVLDWTTTEVTDHLTGGVCDAGPYRLEAAGQAGLPQLIVPGAIDVINVGRGGIPKRWARRVSHMHLPGVPLVRTSIRESREIGGWIAEKLNRSTGAVRVLIPAGGYSALDIRDGPFWDPSADEAFVLALRKDLRPDIAIEVSPHHINDEAFARQAAEALLGLGVARRSASLPREDLVTSSTY
ncbi:MAG: Tm-1-like ATP-binding domain-containing protein [Chloroflexi bacterium]|nr:Tm-1-like ATP-binding domain-containing protein [Chloroflexota bacterium]